MLVILLKLELCFLDNIGDKLADYFHKLILPFTNLDRKSFHGKGQTAELGPLLIFHINIPLGEFFHHVLLLPPTTQRQRLEITKGKHLHTTK